MSEELNRDPLIDKLSRFTPASAGIDREAILFAAGRSSAPTARGWKVAATALALTQTAMLGLWFASSRAPHAAAPPTPVSDHPYSVEFDSPSSQPVELSARNSCGEMLRQWERNGSLPSASVADPGLPHPVLSVAAAYQVLTTD